MVRVFAFLLFVLCFKLSAQTNVPKLINYQGIARDASGNPITSAFDIQFTINNSSSTVHNEVQTGIQPNQFGLFSTKIGSIITLTPSAWNAGPYTLNVSIKTGSTFTLIGSQSLVSVPFALFANDVPSAYSNNILTIGNSSYSITSGSASTPTITGTGLATVTPSTGLIYTVDVPTSTLNFASAGNVLTLTQGSSSSSVALIGTGSSTINMAGAGIAQVNPSTGSNFTVTVPPPSISFGSNQLTLVQGTVTSVAGINPTLNGDVTGPIATTTVTALRNTPVSAATPTSGQVLSMVSGSWTPTTPTLATGPWQKVSTNVSLSVSTDNVGIGTASPAAKLDVIGTSTTTGVILSAKNINNGNTSPAIQAANNGGAAVSATETSSGGANAGEFYSTNGTAVFASSNANNSTSHALESISSSGNTANVAGFFDGGIISKGKTSNSTGNAITVQNSASSGIMVVRNDGNVGIGTTGPTVKLNVIETTAATAALITNSNGDAIAGNSTVGRAILAQGSGSVLAAVEAVNNNTGNSILATKPGGTTNGNAGRFVNASTTNTADAVYAQTNGGGSAIHAVNGPSVTGGSNAALLLEDGHIKLKQTNSPVLTIQTSLSGGTFALVNNSTDVAGTLNFTSGPTGPFPTNVAYPRLTFAKTYATAPVVILTPKSYPAAVITYYVNVTPTYFEIILYNSMVGSSFYEYNYMVIEGK